MSEKFKFNSINMGESVVTPRQIISAYSQSKSLTHSPANVNYVSLEKRMDGGKKMPEEELQEIWSEFMSLNETEFIIHPKDIGRTMQNMINEEKGKVAITAIEFAIKKMKEISERQARPPQCKAEFHSEDGEDSLPYGSHTLNCMLKEGHDGLHEYYGMKPTVIDCTKKCSCPRCEDKK